MPIFYSALLLTGVNLLLRFVGTSFQVYISASLGPEGVGMLQLVLSVGSLAMVAGMAGVRTATMYVAAEEYGRRQKENVAWVLSGCFRYSIGFSTVVAAALYRWAPLIAEHWIGDLRTIHALRLFAGFLPTTCLCGVLTGCFTAANRIGTLAAVEVAEQILSMAVTMLLLRFWAGSDAERACICVIFGSCLGAVLTVTTLAALRMKENYGGKCSVGKRIRAAAIPLAAADLLKSGITTTENLIVPKRLALHHRIDNPLAAFGVLSGMVFPVLMFPACILFGLAELLLPELARCAAAGSEERIRYLVKRSLKAAMLYGIAFGGLLFLLAEPLCLGIYQNGEAGKYLKRYALMIPMLYCDAITDAMTKGLGQQRMCVLYNILTSSMDVAFLYILLPVYGMAGYYVSFLITHLLNFILSLRRLLIIVDERIPFYIPAFSIAAGIAGVWGALNIENAMLKGAAYLLLFASLLYLMKVVGKEDIKWMCGIVKKSKKGD